MTPDPVIVDLVRHCREIEQQPGRVKSYGSRYYACMDYWRPESAPPADGVTNGHPSDGGNGTT